MLKIYYNKETRQGQCNNYPKLFQSTSENILCEVARINPYTVSKNILTRNILVQSKYVRVKNLLKNIIEGLKNILGQRFITKWFKSQVIC